MIRNLVLILIIVLSFSSSRMCAQKGWTETIGTYFLDNKATNVFSEFRYFELETANYWKYLDTSRSYVHLVPKGSGNGVICALKELRMTEDSLSFVTNEYKNTHYSFFGKFTVPIDKVYHNMHNKVLEGTLYWYKDDKLFRKGKVGFIFESGC